MSTWNQIETHLRSWTPRPPSERLREKIFGQPAAADAEPARVMPGLWQWLAPAMAVFVMAFTLSTQTGPGFTRLIASPGNARISELALKNPNLAAYFPSSGHSGHNGWPVATFDWTNDSRPSANDTSTTGNSIWKVSATNSLMQ